MSNIDSSACPGQCASSISAEPLSTREPKPDNHYSLAYRLSICHFNGRLSNELKQLAIHLDGEVERLTLGGTEALKAQRFADAEDLCQRASKLMAAQACVQRLSGEWKTACQHPLIESSNTGWEPLPAQRSHRNYLNVRQQLVGMLQIVDALVRSLGHFGAGCLQARDCLLAQQVCSFAARVTGFRQKLSRALKEDESIDLRH